jgi:TRAP-type transport system small permease protein
MRYSIEGRDLSALKYNFMIDRVRGDLQERWTVEFPDENHQSLAQRVAGIVCGIVLMLFTGLVLYSVMMRYLFHAPPLWGEDIPKLLFVWMSFVGAGFGYLFGFNIRMTTLIDRVPRNPRRVIEAAMHLMILAMLLVILWYSVPILQLASRNTVLSTGLSDIWTPLALPVGTVLLIANEIYRLYKIAIGGIDESGSNVGEVV